MSFPTPSWLFPALVPKLVLVLNHVISSEAAATSRLRPHAGRLVRLKPNGPSGLPSLPALVLLVTPAGLVEAVESAEEAAGTVDLDILLDLSDPVSVVLSGLQGQKPRMEVSGDAALAGDVHWLLENLRWDVEDDLARVVGPIPARELVRWGSWCAASLREATGKVAALATRWRSGSASA